MTNLARRTDPETSHEAAERLVESGRHGSQKAVVYAALCEHPGITSKELALRANLDRHVVARRLPDLREDGKAYTNGRTRDGVLWYPTPEQTEISE